MAKSVETESDNASWVFDSLVGFLHGPIWNIPLQTFTEEKSLPFEPTENGEVSDKPEYRTIHDEYRHLVDMMLGSFMEDIGITAEQFEQACHMSRRELEGLPLHFHRRLFEQVWAANDYAMFVKMMTHKNVELQLQALELIERQCGALPHIFMQDEPYQYTSEDTPSGGDIQTHDSMEKDDIMTEVKKLQLTDSSDNDDVVNAAPEPSKVDVLAEKKLLKSKLDSFEKKVASPNAPVSTTPHTATTTTTAPHEPQGQGAPTKQEVSEEELQQRQEYLKRQRDKLLSLKRQVRERQLEGGAGEGGAPAQARPASARAARAVLAGRGELAATGPPPDSAMQLRRALVDRLKAEVIDGDR